MWDDTNLDLNCKPSLDHAQRIIYSSYYGRKCTKGGTDLQYYGWLSSWDLCTGGVSDYKCLTSNNNQCDLSIIEAQQLLQHKDLVNGKIKPFHNAFEKCYRIIQQILRNNRKIFNQFTPWTEGGSQEMKGCAF